MWHYNHTPSFLMHYGVKGMKWGVRRTKPSGYGKMGSNAVRDAIRSGQVTMRVNPIVQARHMKGSKGYIKGKSYFDPQYTVMDVQRLVNRYAGTGRAIPDRNGNWSGKEAVVAPKIVGTNIDPKTGKERRTNKLVINYSKSRTHVYPGQEEKKI